MYSNYISPHTPSTIDALPAAQAKAEAAKGFTYTVKLGCPKKAGKHNTAAPLEDGVFTLQLPAGWTVTAGSSNPKAAVRTFYAVDDNGLLTWNFPSVPESLSLKLHIVPTTCIPESNLVGRFCLGNGCQAVTLTKPVRACFVWNPPNPSTTTRFT